MMYTRQIGIVLLLLGFFVISCEEKPVPESLYLDKTQVVFTSSVGEQTLQVTANCSWSAAVKEGADWLSVTPSNGQGNGTLTLSSQGNRGTERKGSIKVYSAEKDVRVEVTQSEQEVLYWSISQLRDLYKGVDVKVTEKVVVRGVVVSNFRHVEEGGLNNYTSMKAIVVSDEEAGIQLFCAENNTHFKQGDKVEIQLLDQTLSVYNNGPLQVTNLPLANITKTGTEALVAKEISAAQLVSGDYESMYVAVSNVQVRDQDLNRTFVEKALHTSIGMVAESKETFDVFSSQYSSFKDVVVPSGSGVLKGIACVYGDTYQIIFAKDTDWAGLTGERFYTSPTFFLAIAEKEVSGEEGQFTVSVSGNVDWTVSSSDPEHFSVAPSSGSKSDPVTVTYTQNPSVTESRVADIVFQTTDASVPEKTLTLRITQSPFEALISDAVRSWMELPYVSTDTSEEDTFVYISHMTSLKGKRVRNYSFWYDTENRLASWVAYPLYRDIMGSGSRTNAWGFDPKVPKRYQPVLFYSFAGSNWDRGHQLPSADRLSSQEINESTFYFTNITPQDASFNQNLWNNLERYVRGWALACDTLYVVTGAMIQTQDNQDIDYVTDNDGNRVALPKMYYKVLLRYDAKQQENDGYSAIGFSYENRAYTALDPVAADAVSVKEMEELTGFTFFYNIPSSVQEAVKTSLKWEDWGLDVP
ncbi:MAG TPA: hypothetical protein GXX61_06070 [Bacteroidales bacterium]|nr:hypothetical protein [Bacteroidales bacterium]